MTVGAIKSELPHQKPEMISYQNYQQFDRNDFEEKIKNTLITQKILPKDFLDFKNIKDVQGFGQFSHKRFKF